MAEGFASLRSFSSAQGQAVIPYAADKIVSRTPYSVIVVDVYGNRQADLDQATVESISWELNADHVAVFSVPTKDPKVKFLKVPTTEVQVWRGRALIFWGVLVRGTGNRSRVTFQAVSLGWYFNRRVFGPIPKPVLLANGGFESGTAGWVAKSTGGSSFTVHTTYTQAQGAPVFSGSRVLRLSQTQAGADCWSESSYTYTLPVGTARSDQVTVVAWCWIGNFTAGALQNRALLVNVRDAVTDKQYSFAFTTLDENTPRNKWIRYEVTVPVHPRSGPQRVGVRLYCPHGTVYWDDVSVSIDSRFAYRDTDQATIIKSIVDHSQSSTWGKSSFNIGTNTPLTGVRRSREYLHFEHGVVREALDEFPTLADGVEWDIEITPTRRLLTTYHPRKGSHRSNIVLELGRNIVDYSVDVDGQETSNVVAVIAAGEGPDREEASSKQTGTMNGLILEKVYTATPGSAPQSLKAQANRGLRRYSKPVTVPQITTHEGAGDLIGAINTGDIVPVRVKHGWVDVDGLYRIIRVDLNPKTEQLTFSINPAESSF